MIQKRNKKGFTPLEKTKVEVRGKNLNVTENKSVLLLGRFVRGSSLTGFTLLEVMIACAILVLSITAALQVYLSTSFLVAESRGKTMAITHAKIIAEDIRGWSVITAREIDRRDWRKWLSKTLNLELLPQESVAIETVDWIEGIDTSPRKITVTISWQERGRNHNISLIGGFV